MADQEEKILSQTIIQDFQPAQVPLEPATATVPQVAPPPHVPNVAEVRESATVSPIDHIYQTRSVEQGDPVSQNHIDLPVSTPQQIILPTALPSSTEAEVPHVPFLMPELPSSHNQPLPSPSPTLARPQSVLPVSSPADQTPITAAPEVPKPKRNLKKALFATVVTLCILIVGGVGVALATYRLAPAFAFRYIPEPAIAKINALWPLNREFAGMIPDDVSFFASLQFDAASNQGKQFQELLLRIPGVTDAESLNKSFNTYVQSTYGVSFDQNIRGVFGNTASFAVTSEQSNSTSRTSAYMALPIADVNKARSLLSAIKTGDKTQKLILEEKVYHGVRIFITASPITTPILEAPALLQTLQKRASPYAKLLNPAPAGSKKDVAACASDSRVCAQGQVSDQSSGPAFAVVDRHLIFGDSQSGMRSFIDGHQKKSARLRELAAYRTIASSGQSLFSVLINMQAMQDQAPAFKELYRGFRAWTFQLKAEQSGLVATSHSNYAKSALNPLMNEIVDAPAIASSYAPKLPDSTALFFEGSKLNSRLTMWGQLQQSSSSLDQQMKMNTGVSLSDLGQIFVGDWSFSVQPAARDALVFRASIKDASQTKVILDQLIAKLVSLYPQVSVTHELIDGIDAVVLDDQSGLFEKMKDFFRPAYVINNTELVISSNLAGIQTSLASPTEALVSDQRYKEDKNTVGEAGNAHFFLHSKRFYYAVVELVRAFLGDTDLVQSDQEKVVDAYLDVLASASAVTTPGNSSTQTTSVLPIVTLPTARRAEIDRLISANPEQIFSIAPFIAPLSGSSYARANDSLRKADVVTILRAITSYSADKNDFSDFKTDAVEKLSPDNPHIQLLIRSGDLAAVPLDPDWPDYYYSLESDGNSVEVTTLLENKPEADGSCAPVQIRGRWTWCAEQK